MKNLIIILMLFFSCATKAQITNNETRADALEQEQRTSKYRQKIHDNHIHSVTGYNYKTLDDEKAGKGYVAQELQYDTHGNLIEYKWLKKSGKTKYHNTYKYDDNNRVVEETWLKSNGKLRFRMINTFDAAGNKTDERSYWKRPDNMTWHGIYKYDEKQNILELKYLTGNDRKLYSLYNYSYYPDGSRKQTVEYNRKGKVKHTWNYDCNPTGALVAKNLKDTSKICIRYETDKDGNQIKIKEENVKQGKIVRIVSKYDKNDNLLDRVQYDVKGRAKYHSVGVYDAKSNMTEFTVYKGKDNRVKERSVFHYDTNGNMTELIAYKKAPQPDHVFKYNYTQAQ